MAPPTHAPTSVTQRLQEVLTQQLAELKVCVDQETLSLHHHHQQQHQQQQLLLPRSTTPSTPPPPPLSESDYDYGGGGDQDDNDELEYEEEEDEEEEELPTPLFPPPQPTTTTHLHAHLSSIQSLLQDSNYFILQRIFTIWKRKAWPRVALQRRVRRAFGRLVLLRQASRRLTQASTHHNHHKQRRALYSLQCRLALLEHRQALIAHVERARLHQQGRHALRRLSKRVRTQKIKELLTLQHQAHLLQTSLLSWRQTLTCHRHLHKKAHHLLAHAFIQWRRSIKIEQEQHKLLTTHLRLRRGLYALRQEQHRLQQRGEAACYFMRQLRPCKVMLLKWRWDVWQRRKTVKLTEKMAFVFAYQRMIRKGLLVLAEHREAQRDGKRIEARADTLYHSTLLSRTLQQWALAAKQQALEMDALAQARIHTWRQHQRRLAFLRLRHHHHRHRHWKAVKQSILHKAAKRLLCQWRTWTHTHTHTTHLLEAHAARRQSTSLHHSLHQWQHHTHTHIASRRVTRLHHTTQLHLVLHAFHHHHTTRQKARLLTHTHTHTQQKHCLHWWRRATTHTATLRKLYMRRGVRLWRLHLAHHHLEKEIELGLGTTAWKRSKLHEGLHALRVCVLVCREKEGKMAAARLHYTHRQQQRCHQALTLWKQESQARSFRHQLQQQATIWQTQQHKTRTLLRFSQTHAHTKMTQTTQNIALQFWAHRRRRQGLLHLHRHHWTTVILPTHHQRITQAWHLQRAWKKWREIHTQKMIYGGNHRYQQLLFLRASLHWEGRRLAHGFQALKRARCLVLQRQLTEQRVYVTTLSTIWHDWRRQYLLNSKLRLLTHHTHHHLLHRALHGWVRLTEVQPQRRAALTETIHTQRRHKVFTLWRAQLHARQLLAWRAAAVQKASESWTLHRAFSLLKEAHTAILREKEAERYHLKRWGIRPWLQWLIWKKQQQGKITKIQALDAVYMRQRVLKGWVEAQRLSRREEAALRVLAARRATVAMRKLEEGVMQARQLRACDRHLLVRHLAYWRCFVARAREDRAWKRRVVAWQAHHPQTCEALVSLFPSGQKRLAFTQWVVHAASRLREREAGKCGDVHHARFAALKALKRLTSAAHARQEARAQEGFAQDLALHAHTFMCFHKFRLVVRTRRQARLREKRRGLEQRWAQEDKQCVIEAFLRWSAYSKQMEMARTWLKRSSHGAGRIGGGGFGGGGSGKSLLALPSSSN